MLVHVLEISYITFRRRPYQDGLYFIKSNWDDFGYKTTYSVYLVKDGIKTEIGSIKFGRKTSGIFEIYVSQDQIDNGVTEEFFSLGSLGYYRTMRREFSKDDREELFVKLNDIAFNTEVLDANRESTVLWQSLLRDVSESDIYNQYNRIATGGEFTLPRDLRINYYNKLIQKEISHNFSVNPSAKIPTNLHAIIGRNGSGKTYLLTKIYESISEGIKSTVENPFSAYSTDNYLSKVLFISFGTL